MILSRAPFVEIHFKFFWRFPSSTNRRRFAIFESLKAKLKNAKKKSYFHLVCTNTHADNGAMLAVSTAFVSVCLCGLAGEVNLWRNVLSRKNEISIEFIRVFFSAEENKYFLTSFLHLRFSFCRSRRLATMAAISRLSRSSASRSRKRRSRGHSNAYSSHTGRWMLWVESSIECAYRRRKMCTRTRDAAWLRQLRIKRNDGELKPKNTKKWNTRKEIEDL